MDVFGIIESFGVPIAVSVGLGYALMYLIKFVTKDVSGDLRRRYDIIVKLIDSNREMRDETKKTMTSVHTIKDVFLRLFRKDKR